MTTNTKFDIQNTHLDREEDEITIRNQQEFEPSQDQKSKSQQQSKKLTNQERQNAVFSSQKQFVDSHPTATKQYHQQQQCIKQAQALFNELNLERKVLEEQVEIIKEEIQKENIDIFRDLKDQIKKIQGELQLGVKNANEDQDKIELQIQDLRKQKMDLGNQFGYVLGNFEKLYDKTGYTSQDMQNVQNSMLLQDSSTLGYSSRSMMQNNN